MSKPEIVTICGSTRFRAEVANANRALTLAGYVVLAPGVFAHDGDQITDEQKRALDALHFQKIDLSRSIYVVNPGGYVGESTRREIEYAERAGKSVRFLVPLATAQCPHCTSPYRHHRFVMPAGDGTERCGHGWHDGDTAGSDDA